MEKLSLSIIRKSYIFYRYFYLYRDNVNKQDRYSIWQKSENLFMDIFENIYMASQTIQGDKLIILTETSIKLNFFKILIRLIKDIKILDNKKYIFFEELLDEIGRMLGG